MKCPLLAIAYMSYHDDKVWKKASCLQEECAWWVKASGSCAMEAIPRIIGFIGSELKGIREKMPHEEAP